jgi:hypothetical protein
VRVIRFPLGQTHHSLSRSGDGPLELNRSPARDIADVESSLCVPVSFCHPDVTELRRAALKEWSGFAKDWGNTPADA